MTTSIGDVSAVIKGIGNRTRLHKVYVLSSPSGRGVDSSTAPRIVVAAPLFRLRCLLVINRMCVCVCVC